MKKMNSVLSIRPIVILLCVVFFVFVMCGSAAADNYVYVPEFPPGGDNATPVNTSLVSALENGSYDVIVLTNNTNLTDAVTINSSNTTNKMVNLISYYPEGLSIDANGNTITIPDGNGLTIGTGKEDESHNHKVYINGGGNDHLFLVKGTLIINQRVFIYNNNVIDSVIVADGKDLSHKGNVIINGGKIYGNTAGISTINIKNATVTMNSGNISNNRATAMTGGILIDSNGTFVMNNGYISYNSGAKGGGVYIEGGKFLMTGGNIENNIGAESGGGVQIYGGDFTMTGGNIENNSVTEYGGGVYNEGGKFEMKGGNIKNNNGAELGGGVYISNGLSNGSLNMTGGNIENNNGAKLGGGVYISNGVFIMTGGNIKNSSTSENGGGVYVARGNFTLGDENNAVVNIENNTAANYGGAVYLHTNETSAIFTMNSGTISGNTAKVGGGVYLSNYNELFITKEYNVNYMEGANFTMTGGQIINNRADIAGGVFVPGKQVYMPENRTKFIQTIFNMSGGSIINNTASPVVVSAGKFVMNGGSITGNNNLTEPTVIVSNTLDIDPTLNVKYKGIFEMGGGHIYDNLGNHSYIQNDEGIVKLSGGSIYYTGVNNTSTGVVNYGNLNISGNAQIYGFKNHGIINYESFGMSGGTVSYNEAKNGGGIYSENSFVMSGGTIASNKASDYGGGIFTNDSLTMTGGIITGNNANYSGAVSFRNNFDMSGGEISNNYALSGGAFSLTDIANTSMTFNFFGGRIHSNTAEDNSGIYFTHGDFNLGDSGLVNENNNVLIGSSQRINIVSNLTEDSGVYSIIPLTNSQQTVAVVSVPRKNATDFIGNFDLYYKNSPLSYYNTLETSGLNIVTSHKDIPEYGSGDHKTLYSGYVACSVTFEPMNGENATFKSVPFNDLVPRPEDPVYGTADFLGWSTAYEYEWDFENDTVMSPLTLYAQWYGVPSQKVSPIAVPEPVTDNSSGLQIPTILIAAVAAAIIAAGVVLTVVIIRKRRNSDDDDDYDDE